VRRIGAAATRARNDRRGGHWSGHVARQGRAAVGTEATIGGVAGATTETALLARRAEVQRWRGRARGSLGAGHGGRRSSGWRGGFRRGRVQAIPTILAELETVRVVPAAAAAVHDVVASSAVRT